MRAHRFNLEEQVGGLVDHGDRRVRRRKGHERAETEPVDPQRYELTAPATPAIRAARASDDQAQRHVA